MNKLLNLTLLTLLATLVDFVVINCTHWGGWIYILVGWFIAWLVIHFLIVDRRWLISIGLVLIVSVVEDVLFLLLDRIVGIIPWGSQWYCHDWMPFAQNWWGVPSSYFILTIIGAILIVINKMR